MSNLIFRKIDTCNQNFE